MDTTQQFDPSRHLISLNGELYLEVKWRLAWLRSVFPDAVLQTELVEHADGRALFKATATVSGGASATGYGSETAENFADYIEAAETKAIGRSLAALGFGSQFCTDFDLGSKPVDAPVSRPGAERAEPEQTVSIDQPVTTKQMNLIRMRARELKLNDRDLEELSDSLNRTSLADLNRRQASRLIDELGSRMDARADEKAS